jgi:hypothetical protein
MYYSGLRYFRHRCAGSPELKTQGYPTEVPAGLIAMARQQWPLFCNPL